MLDPKKLMLGREQRCGYHRHEERDGRHTYSVEVQDVLSGAMVYFECVASLTAAITRASELTDCFADCRFAGNLDEKIEEASDVP